MIYLFYFYYDFIIVLLLCYYYFLFIYLFIIVKFEGVFAPHQSRAEQNDQNLTSRYRSFHYPDNDTFHDIAYFL